MGTKRVGLARTQALIEGLKRELAMGGTAMTGVERIVEAKTASFTIAAADSGKVFTNRGDGDAMTITLPDPDGSTYKGVEFFTVNYVAQQINLTTATADTLVSVGDVTADTLRSAATGQWMRCFCDGTSWYAEPTTDGGTYVLVS